MADSFVKVDNNRIKKIYSKEETVSYNMLLSRKEFLEAELTKVNAMIAAADGLGIVPIGPG